MAPPGLGSQATCAALIGEMIIAHFAAGNGNCQLQQAFNPPFLELFPVGGGDVTGVGTCYLRLKGF